MRDYAICPKCKKPTKIAQGMSRRTLMYFQPIIDKNGNNINPDRNTTTTEYKCLECGEHFEERT